MLRPSRLRPASAAIVMALGIFALAAARRLPLSGAALSRSLAIALLILWAIIAFEHLWAWLAGGLHRLIHDPRRAFVSGTWVAATAVTGELLARTFPQQLAAPLALGVVAILLWIVHFRLSFAGLRAIAGPACMSASGTVLLPTVAMQSLVLLGQAIAGASVPAWLDVGLIAAGYVYYAAGLVLVVRRYALQRGWHLAGDWDDANCILHGALSISGLAGVATGALSPPALWVSWLGAAALFVIVEGVEFARMAQRLRHFGLRYGVLTYYAPQWTRNFTVGMFYAFSVAVHGDRVASSVPAVPGLLPVLEAIVGYGQYVVLLLLVIETGLLAAHFLARWVHSR